MTDSASLGTLFPWIRNKSTDLPAEGLTAPDVVAAVLADRSHVVLGALFPRVPLDTPLNELSLGARVENLLTARHESRFEALSEYSLDDIAKWRNIGVGALEELVRGLVEATARFFSAVGDGADVDAGTTSEIAENLEWLDTLVADVTTIARWRRLLGAEQSPIFSTAEQQTEPRDVRAARARLLALSASEVLPPERAVGEAAALVQRALHGLGDRELAIVRTRLLADDPATLDALGIAYDVSRERIRQLEAKISPLLRSRVHSGDLGSLAEAARETIGVVLPLRTLLQRFPTLAETVPELEQPVWRVLDRLDDAYEIADGWCVPGTIREAVTQTKEILSAASSNGRFVDIAAVDASMSEEWLDYAAVPTMLGFALLGRASIPDRAEVVLHREQSPLATADLLSRLGVDRSINALKNALATDARFERVNRDEWALKEWGLDGYAPIHALIGRALDASGGSIPLVDLVSDLTRRFDVSPKSVASYASGFPYTTERGTVRRRTRRDMRSRARGRGLAQTKGLFRFLADVRLRVVLTGDHLRGSGSSVPNALGEELDLGIGEVRELASPSGAVQLSRPRAQILLGSVRAEVARIAAREGDIVFFVFGADGSFRIQRLVEGDDADVRIAGLAGGEVDDQDLVQALADRIDAQSATREVVREALASRGDAELAELLDRSSSGATPAAVELRALTSEDRGGASDGTGVLDALDDVFEYILRNVDVWTAQTYRRGSAFAPYIQGLREFDGGFACELSSNAFLEPPLRPEQLEALRFLGWRDPDPSGGFPNFHQAFDAAMDLAVVAQMLTKTLIDAIQIDPEDDIEFGPHTPELDAFVAQRLQRSD